MDITFDKITIAIVFLFRALAAQEYKLHEESVRQYEAASTCTLAAPKVKLTADGYTVSLKNIGADLEDGAIIWTGHAELYHWFQYKGCNRVNDVNYEQKHWMIGDIGTCYSACETNYIGIMGKNDEWTCFCLEAVLRFDTTNACKHSCNSSSHVCGGDGFMSIYQHIKEGVQQPSDGDATCLAYSGSTHMVFWQNCKEEYFVICEEQGSLDSRWIWHVLDWFQTWPETMKTCFKKHLFPTTATRVSNGNPSGDHWTGGIRSPVRTVNRTNPTGYLVKRGTTFILHFEFTPYPKTGRSLCAMIYSLGGAVKVILSATEALEATTYESETQAVVTEHPYDRSDDGTTESTTMHNQETPSSHTTESTVPVTNQPLHLSTETNVTAMYVAIPLSLCLIVAVIVTIVFCRRRRRANAENGRREETMEMKKPRLRTVGNAIYETGEIEPSLMDTRQRSNQQTESREREGNDGVYQHAFPNTQASPQVVIALGATTDLRADNGDETEYDTTLAGNRIDLKKSGETDNVYNKLEEENDDTYGNGGASGHTHDTSEDTYNHLGDKAESNYEVANAASSKTGQMIHTDDVYSKTSSP